VNAPTDRSRPGGGGSETSSLDSGDVPAIIAPAADTLPVADVPVRRPTLAGRKVRARTIYEVRTRFVVDGEVETYIYRRENAALAHAARLRAQGWPVLVTAGVVTWQVHR